MKLNTPRYIYNRFFVDLIEQKKGNTVFCLFWGILIGYALRNRLIVRDERSMWNDLSVIIELVNGRID